MFQSLIDLFPAEWRGPVMVLAAPLRWIPEWQTIVLTSMSRQHPATVVVAAAMLLMPVLLLIAGMWSTMVSLYTLPFRSGRGGFVTALLMAWWDAGRCIWLYWAGLARLTMAVFGWVLGALRFILLTLRNTVFGLVRSPMALLDWTSRRYFQPGVPWIAFLVLLLWSAVEATVFTFTLQPTLNEVFGGLTGFEPNPRVMGPLLWLFLFMLVAGSFACIQVLNEAIKARQTGNIIFMILVEIAVAMFEVLFLYRELVDAMTPWLAQQGIQLGVIGTIGLAFFGWVGVRGMTWFLFGRFGAPALIGLLGRQAFAVEGSVPHGSTAVPDYWKGPISALKAEREWFRKESRELFELASLPVLQVVAAGMNFLFVVFTGRGHFTLPFKSIDDVLAATHFPARVSGEVAR